MKASSVRHTTCEKQFVEKSIKNGIRLDGRQSYDYRNIEIKFGEDYGYCEVILGDTRVLAQTSCELVKPMDSRPTDGQLFLNVDLSPMASPAFESGRMTMDSIEINRLVERVLKESRPIDTESLCVLAGEKVWSVRVDILVLNNAGNILDCCCIAAISSLAHFRRPDVSVSGHDVTIHTSEEKELIPLSVHHMPLCVTFGFIDNGQQIIIDPEEKEESIISGKLMMAFNILNELCCVQMSGGVCLDYEQLLQCANMAALKASEITEILKEALEEDKVQRAPEPIKRREGLKTPIQPRDFITKTTAEPTTNNIITIDENRSNGSLSPDQSTEVADHLGHRTSSIGMGSKNAWIISDNSDEEMTTENTERKDEISTNNASNPTIDYMAMDDDSEEEDVVIMNSSVLTEKSIPNEPVETVDDNDSKASVETSSNKKKKTRKRKKKGGNTT